MYLDNREIVQLGAISRATQRAVLAIEDSDYFQHGAMDVSSLIRRSSRTRKRERWSRAARRSRSSWSAALGRGQDLDESIEGKIQELALAVRVEQQYSKEEIFELYLNQVYMGNGVYGFGTAAKFYFRKPARELTLARGSHARRLDP